MLAGGLAFAGFVIYSLFTLEPIKVVRSHLEHDGNRVFVDDKLVTPHTEAFQAVVWHCLVSHPKLQRQATKW